MRTSPSAAAATADGPVANMSVEPQITETPPRYDDVVAEEQGEQQAKLKSSVNDNIAYEPDITEVVVAREATEAPTGGKGKVAVIATSSGATNGGKVEEVEAVLSEEEEKMLSILRQVAQKCTHANPQKRPTAEQVLKMLHVIDPYPEGYDAEGESDVDVHKKSSDAQESIDTTAITLTTA